MQSTGSTSIELGFSPDGEEGGLHWVPLSSILDGGLPVVPDGDLEGEDEVFLGLAKLTLETQFGSFECVLTT